MEAQRLLRAVCGHDSWSVEGCEHCDAADAVGRRYTQKQVDALVAGERDRCARMTTTGSGYFRSFQDADQFANLLRSGDGLKA
jgi:hypothetical protein